MSKFTNILKDMMCVYEHTEKQMAEAFGVDEDTVKEILDEKIVPDRAAVMEMCDTYHIEPSQQKLFEKAWAEAKRENTDRMRRMERVANAKKYLAEHINTGYSAEKRCCIVALAQYIHNMYTDGGAGNPTLETVMKMRSVYVYNLGSDQAKEYDEALMGESPLWFKIQEEVKRILCENA